MRAMRANLSTAIVLTVLVLAGCGGWRRTGSASKAEIGASPVSSVELTIGQITQAQAQEFVEQLEDYGDVNKVELKSWTNNTAVYAVEVDGCECDLPAMLAEIPTPGFRYLGRTTRVQYEAYDNVSPTLEFVSPDEGTVTKERKVTVEVEIPDGDLVEVTIAGMKAERSGTRYRVAVALKEGSNDILAVAKDTTGNVSQANLRIGLDATPPEVSGTLSVLIEGDVAPGTKVFVNGSEVEVDSSGHYAAPVKVQKGQREVKILAVDRYGNRNETSRSIGD